MKYIDGATPPWGNNCNPMTNVYDCERSATFFWLVVIAHIMNALGIIIGAYVIWYRRKKGIAKGLFYRAGDYCWLPNPIDSLVIVGTAATVIRLIHFTMILTDWPKSFTVRNLIMVFTITMPIQAILLFIAGIIAHIPSSFIRSSRVKQENYGAVYMVVPGSKKLSWAIIVFALAYSVVDQPMSIWMGISEDTGRFDQYELAYTIAIGFSSIYLAVLGSVSVYYWLGFRRIMRHLIDLLEERNKDTEENKAQQVAATRFLTIFRYLTLYIVIIAPATASAIWMQNKTLNDPNSNIMSFSAQYIVFYPLFLIFIFWQLRTSSFERVRQRDRGQVAGKEPITPQKYSDIS
ncbi:hypothetical protein THASP1DRAFT_32933, partial [Thamnocephalis sphaerospora]